MVQTSVFLGSKERYQSCIKDNTATFFYSADWLEQYEDYNLNPESTTKLMGLGSYDDYVREYGEENAGFLQEQLGGGLESYDKFTFIDTGVGNRAKPSSRAMIRQ